jgi:hypothetical protein
MITGKQEFPDRIGPRALLLSAAESIPFSYWNL